MARVLPLMPTNRYTPHVICTESLGVNAQFLIDAGVTVELISVPKRTHPIGIWRLARRLRQLQPRVVHSHMFASNVTATIAAHLGVRHTPMICHIHMVNEWGSPSRIKTELRLDRWRKKYIVVSQDCKNYMGQHLGGINEEKIAVLLNSAGALPPPTESKEAMRRLLGIPTDAQVIGMVARLDEEKGPDVLLQACTKLFAENHDNRRLLVVGGKYLDRYQQLAKDLGIEKLVYFAGEQLDVSNYYAAMDLLAVPSRQEAFGLVLVEAMQFGLPIVASNVGGIPEVARDGKEALLIPPEDPDKLADAITMLLENPPLAATLGQNGLKRAGDFAPQVYVERLCDIYDSVLMTHF
ncbi:glycosyltransferase family 4 protein [Candidatus Sumerlaeota bacterium]|nr:glycosyltransferase family 4 protein [Candidatus Sumerlaeota bacterium]